MYHNPPRRRATTTLNWLYLHVVGSRTLYSACSVLSHNCNIKNIRLQTHWRRGGLRIATFGLESSFSIHPRALVWLNLGRMTVGAFVFHMYIAFQSVQQGSNGLDKGYQKYRNFMLLHVDLTKHESIALGKCFFMNFLITSYWYDIGNVHYLAPLNQDATCFYFRPASPSRRNREPTPAIPNHNRLVAPSWYWTTQTKVSRGTYCSVAKNTWPSSGIRSVCS